MRDIKSIAANTASITFVSLIFLFAFTWVIFDFHRVDNSLKDTWSIVSSLFGGAATLAAAYIASLVYGEWRLQESFNRTKMLHDDAIGAILKSVKALGKITSTIQIMQHEAKKKGQLTEDEKTEFSISLNNTTKNVVIEVQEITHDICVKIALDYMESLKKDAELKFAFDTLIEIKLFVQKLANQKGVHDGNFKEVIFFIDNLNHKLDKKIEGTLLKVYSSTPYPPQSNK